jgi:hypothetical protein
VGEFYAGDAQLAMDWLDGDGSGTVNLEEFVAWVKARRTTTRFPFHPASVTFPYPTNHVGYIVDMRTLIYSPKKKRQRVE